MQHSKRKDIIIVLVAVLLAAASLSTIGMLHVDSSTDVFIPKQDPVNKINDQIEDQFGSLDAIIIGLSVENGTILNKESLTLLEKLTNEIEDLDFVAQVISLTKTDHMEAGLDGFEVVPLYTGTTDEQIVALKEKIESWSDVYEGALISGDQKMVAMVVQPNRGSTQTQIESLLDSIQVLLNDNKSSDQQFSILGLPSVKKQINRSLLSDVAILAPIAGLLIILVLLFSFRRLAGIILPLAGLLISASITLGIMAVLQITFTMATMLVPVLLLIVGSAYAIHVMSHFYAEIALTKGAVSYDDTVQIIDMVLKRNTLPIIMAGATTAAGFIAQLTSPLGPFRTFGLLSAVGVVLSQLSSLYLLPALLRLTYHNGVRMEKVNLSQEIKSNRFYTLLEKIAIKGKVPLATISLILFAVTIMLIPKINVGTNMIKFFSKSSSLVQDTERYNNHMAGSGILTIMIDGKESSSILEPSFLNTLDQFSAEIEKIENVGKVQTVTPYIKRMNYLMNQDNPPYRQAVVEQAEFDFFGGSFGFFGDFEEVEDEVIAPIEEWDPATYIEIPSEPAKYGLETTDDLKALLSQYLLLYAGNLDQLINDDVEPSATLITVQMRDSDSNYLRTVKESIDSFWSENLPSGWTYMVGGGDAISLALTDLVTKSQIYSLVGALIIVWLLVGLIFRSPVAGLFALIPITFALMGIFLFMAILNIPLDIITSLLAALAIGIGVDYAIHFIAAYKRQLAANLSPKDLTLTMNTTGRAIIINAASVIIGFSGLLFSRFIPIQQMGVLFCVSMIFSSVASLTVLPMALIWFRPKFTESKLG